MKNIYVAHVMNSSADHYLFAFKNKPTDEQVILKLSKLEGLDLSHYEDTLVTIEKVKVD